MDIVDPPAEFHRPDDGLTVVTFGPPRGYAPDVIGTAGFRFPSIHTYWRPTDDELTELQAGAVVRFAMVTVVSAGVYPPPPDDAFTGRCGACGHPWSEHGRDGCADDDEAAMGGCDCVKQGAPT